MFRFSHIFSFDCHTEFIGNEERKTIKKPRTRHIPGSAQKEKNLPKMSKMKKPQKQCSQVEIMAPIRRLSSHCIPTPQTMETNNRNVDNQQLQRSIRIYNNENLRICVQKSSKPSKKMRLIAQFRFET